MAKILVGFPTKTSVDAEAATAAANLDACGNELTYAYADGRGVYGAAQARNKIAQKAVAGKYDYVLMIDSDTIVPPDALEKLLSWNVDICLGLYRYKNETGDCPFFKCWKDGDSDKWKFDEVPGELFEVKEAGLGCALIRTSVFDKIAVPWFHWDERPTGRHTSEDIWFCRRAKEAGYMIWADGRVKCAHAGRRVYR